MRAWNRARISARSCWWFSCLIVRPTWRQHVAVSLSVVRLAVAIALLPFAIDWRSPLLAGYRPVALSALVAVPLLLLAIDGWMLRKPQSGFRWALSVAVVLAAGAALIATLSLEARFQWVRARVLAADPARLEIARPAFRRRLSRSGGDRSGSRPSRRRRRVRRCSQCRRTFGRRHPRTNRVVAGYTPASGTAAALGRHRPGGRCGVTPVAAIAAAAADLVGGGASMRTRPRAMPRRTTTDWRRVAPWRVPGSI